MKMSPERSTITVEVAYARPERQWLIRLEVDAGTTVDQALQRSGLLEEIEEFRVSLPAVGLHGHLVPASRLLAHGDRVEVYRPLLADPKLTRRKRAKKRPIAKKEA